jgi:hypothetical protein
VRICTKQPLHCTGMRICTKEPMHCTGGSDQLSKDSRWADTEVQLIRASVHARRVLLLTNNPTTPALLKDKHMPACHPLWRLDLQAMYAVCASNI